MMFTYFRLVIVYIFFNIILVKPNNIKPKKIDIMPNIRSNYLSIPEPAIGKGHNHAEDFLSDFEKNLRLIRQINVNSLELDSTLLELKHEQMKRKGIQKRHLESDIDNLIRYQRQTDNIRVQEILALYKSILRNAQKITKRGANHIDKINLEENKLERIKTSKKKFRERLNPESKADLIPAKIYDLRNQAFNHNRYFDASRNTQKKRRQKRNSNDRFATLIDQEYDEIDPKFDSNNNQGSLEPHIRTKRKIPN